MTDDKIIKVYTIKDTFVFSGLLIKLDSDFLTLHDFKTDKDITIPVINISRIEEVKQWHK